MGAEKLRSPWALPPPTTLLPPRCQFCMAPAERVVIGATWLGRAGLIRACPLTLGLLRGSREISKLALRLWWLETLSREMMRVTEVYDGHGCITQLGVCCCMQPALQICHVFPNGREIQALLGTVVYKLCCQGKDYQNRWMVWKLFLINGNLTPFWRQNFCLPGTSSTVIPGLGFASHRDEIWGSMNQKLLTAIHLGKLWLLQDRPAPASFPLLVCPQLATLNHTLQKFLLQVDSKWMESYGWDVSYHL